MEFWETIRVALTAIIRNKIRSFLTVLGIVIGVSSVILLVGIGTGIKIYITGQLESLGTNLLFVMPGKFALELGGTDPGGALLSSKLRLSHVKDLQRKGGDLITAVSAAAQGSSTLEYRGKTKFTQINGVDESFPDLFNNKVEKGSFFDKAAVSSSSRVIVLGSTVAEELFGEHNPLGKKVSVDETIYRVIGVLESKGAISGIDYDDNVYVPVTTHMRQFDLERIHAIYAKAKDEDSVTAAISKIEAILKEDLDEDDFTVLNQKDLLSTLSQIFAFLTLALGGIAAISLLVGGIGIMNIMFVSVTERTREVGLRKALGATFRNILVQFLFEAVVLSLVGGLLGLALGAAGSLLLSRWLQTQITLWSVILAFGFSSAVGIIFGVAPALKAARLDPIQALRYE
jgi:putative ABC transport system permease protein